MRLAITFFVLCMSCMADVGRSYDFYADMDILPEKQRLDFYRKDSLSIVVYVYRDGSSINLSGSGLVVLLELAERNEPDDVVASFVGYVDPSSSGVVVFDLDPSETDIASDLYDGYLSVNKYVEGFISEVGLVCDFGVNILESYP